MGLYDCDVCGQECKDNKALKTHKKNRHQEHKDCDKFFSRPQTLKEHQVKGNCKGKDTSGRPSTRPQSFVVPRHFANLKLPPGPQRIVEDFQGVCNVLKPGVIVQTCYLLEMNEEYGIAKASYESLRKIDVFGESDGFKQNAQDNIHFAMDWEYEKAGYRQPNLQDFNGQPEEKAHVVTWENHCQNWDDCLATMVAPNAVPIEKAGNLQLLSLETRGRNILLEHGRVLSITLIFVRDKENVKYLKDKGETAIPDAVDKIYIFRSAEGLNIEGWEMKRLGTSENPWHNFVSAPVDPFKNIVESKIDFVAPRSVFVTQNGVVNPDYQKDNADLFPETIKKEVPVPSTSRDAELIILD